MVAAVVILQPDEVVAGRPFTDVQHTQTDLAILRYLVAHLEMTLDSRTSDEQDRRPLERYFPTAERWWHRVMVTQPECLLAARPLIIVGFFGQRRHNLNVSRVELAHALDKSLMSELPSYEDLLAYCTLALPTGDYSNLVVFAREEGIKHWGRSKTHAEAVRELTPDYYLSVRLYNGLLPSGLQRADELRLTQVKYYDYQQSPQWRAVRPFQ
jgi:hypothetical protein